VKVVFFDDSIARGFEPFALTRPISTLVSGMMPIGARWEIIGGEAAGFMGAEHLADFVSDDFVSVVEPASGSIIANSRFAPHIGVMLDPSADVWTSGGRVVAAKLTRGLRATDLRSGSFPGQSLAGPGARTVEIKGWWHDEVWDFLRLLPEILTADITFQAHDRTRAVPRHVTVLGKHPVVAADAEIEPHVVLDASDGPIFILEGAHIQAFTRISGPCFIGRNATILGGDVRGCSIGAVSKIRGEVSGSIVHGYSNKGHEGFVGNSYLGEWVNLGAGTTTSNLKNTYGSVSLWTPTGVRGTGMQFLGTLFGDHVKTGIGTMLTTGTVLGAGANVFGSQMPPKAVAPFSWGDGEPYGVYKIEKFLESAEKVMARRKVTLTDRMKKQLTASFERRWSVS
jgi:UDP-N-acetylglucosamine diphosphorylase / glucose-1-phosphate thymidylyltransferase / UDP-N-acetylgalactosamine diphosphorylase / glucosamine-1-phosphate N-acetyltransferase / galactosamine-1-phosphate N-acetyltransferase